MKHALIKSALLRTVAILLLTFGSVSASAQYYMNIYPKNGQKVRYVIADLDSINFSDQSESSDDYEYVDLGLSVNWATHNVGASKYVEDYGDYYAWGETEYKSEYSWSTYKYSNNAGFVTKYCNDANKGYNGFVDNKTTLDPIDDVAHIKWGGDWRTPTIAEFKELQRNCDWLWTTQNGINGYKVTSKVTGYTDRSIFLPAAGYHYLNDSWSVDSGGFYWSSSLVTSDPCHAYNIYAKPKTVGWSDGGNRMGGLSVRPVRLSEEWITKETLYVLNKEELTINFSKNDTLYILPYKGYENAIDIIPVSVQWYSDNPSVATVDYNGIVTGLSEGTSNIIATIHNNTFSCIVTVIPKENGSHNGYQYIELGLSVKWASFNVGSLKPEEYGDYYAWGETETKDTYNWFTYKWCNGSYSTLTKYNNSDSCGTVDNKTVLDPEDDVAHVKWGGSWRMPTKAERDELIKNCTWTWYSSDNTEFNGVAGYKVTSNKSGYTDRFIFLPAAGYRQDKLLNGAGYGGSYWFSSIAADYQYNAHHLIIVPDGVDWYGSNHRYYGQSVRPVCP